MKIQISLYSDDAKRFEDMRETVADLRDGYEPKRSELARMMMDQFDPEEAIGAVRERR